MLEETMLKVLKDSDSKSLWEIYSEVGDQVLVPGEYVMGIGELVTLKGLLNKLSFEGKIVQEKGTFWKGL